VPEPILVADATGFILFAKANRFGVLFEITKHAQVLIAPLVFQEVAGARSAGRPGAAELTEAARGWVAVQAPSAPTVVPPSSLLSSADVQSLTLAQELGATLYADDRPLRGGADRLGVSKVGSLGLLAAASQCGVMEPVTARAHGVALRQAGLRVAPSLWKAWTELIGVTG